VCGKRLNKSKGKAQPVYSCAEASEDLSAIVGVDNSKERDHHILPQLSAISAAQKSPQPRNPKKMDFHSVPLSLRNGHHTRKRTVK